MQQQVAAMRKTNEEYQEAENAVNLLTQAGLLKRGPTGDMLSVSSWEEHQQLLQQRQ